MKTKDHDVDFSSDIFDYDLRSPMEKLEALHEPGRLYIYKDGKSVEVHVSDEVFPCGRKAKESSMVPLSQKMGLEELKRFYKTRGLD